MKTKPLISALNEMLRCYDYGKTTTKIEWAAAASNARNALDEIQAAKRAKSSLPNRVSLNLSREGWEPSGKFLTVQKETLEAYADSRDEANGYERRNLAFKASHSVCVVDAMDIMKSACPHGYNEFTHKVLQYLPLDSGIILAREGSPCVYVLGPRFDQSPKLLADEFDFYPDEYVKDYGTPFKIPGPVTRVWWD